MRNFGAIVIGILLTFNVVGQVSFELVSDGFGRPLDIVNDGVSPGVYVVDQLGKIFYYHDDNSTEVANLSSVITTLGNEQGLLGLAFHPSYPEDNRLFIYYTRPGNAIVIASLQQEIDTKIIDENSLKTILEYEQPFRNHNGGCLKFGPDNYLYIGTGDGGSGGDPGNRSQNLMNPLGKMLRIDIDNGDPYSVPDDNPFEDDDFALNEIWSYGLRNPWRFSFDDKTGDLWIGDVGQDAREEINRQLAESTGGENYGWRCKEGIVEFNTDSCDISVPDALTDPYYDYPHAGNGCSVTGGVVSYSNNVGELKGKYIYGDICTANIWAIDFSGDRPVNEFIGRVVGGGPSTFGSDIEGRLYTASLNTGSIYEIVGTVLSSTVITDKTIEVHPSIVDQFLYLKGIDRQDEVSYSIYNLNGQHISTQQGITDRVDVSALGGGTYLLNVIYRHGNHVHRFIKH